MKNFFLKCTLMLLATSSQAQVITTNTSSGRDSEIKFGECHYKWHDPFKGTTRVTTKSKPQIANYSGPLMSDADKSEVSIQFSCHHVSKVELRDCGMELKDGKLNTSGTDPFTEEEKKQFHEELITLKGKNWEGAGVQSEYTYENRNQNRDFRLKKFNFCLRHNETVLTGYVSAVGEVGKPKESALPNIIKLLESVEFLDDASIQ